MQQWSQRGQVPQINLTAQRPAGFTPQQTAAATNFQRAQAHAASDPRMHMKGFDKAGLSRGTGQQGYAAASAAQAYADKASDAESAALQDAVANSNLDLQFNASQDQQALALARIQEQLRNQRSMFGIQQQADALGFTGNMFGKLAGSGGGLNSLLSGLLT